MLGNNVTPLLVAYVAHLLARTPSDGQFGWGGTRPKKYRLGPKVSSSGSEIRCRVQEQKLALLDSYQDGFQLRKYGLANLHVLIDGGWR